MDFKKHIGGSESSSALLTFWLNSHRFHQLYNGFRFNVQTICTFRFVSNFCNLTFNLLSIVSYDWLKSVAEHKSGKTHMYKNDCFEIGINSLELTRPLKIRAGETITFLLAYFHTGSPTDFSLSGSKLP
jgi:hypothetical protein